MLLQNWVCLVAALETLLLKEALVGQLRATEVEEQLRMMKVVEPLRKEEERQRGMKAQEKLRVTEVAAVE